MHWKTPSAIRRREFFCLKGLGGGLFLRLVLHILDGLLRDIVAHIDIVGKQALGVDRIALGAEGA